MTDALYSTMAESIGTAIVSGDLPAGTTMTLEAMQTQYGVSRTVARECMRLLESIGLVSSQRRTGIAVRPLQDWDVFDRRVIRWRLDSGDHMAQLRSLTELRIALEPVAASLAAHRATEQEQDTLMQAAGEMLVFGRSGRLERYLAADLQFHQTVLRASHNEMFAALAEPVVEAVVERPLHGHAHTYPVPEAMDLHEQVMNAICNGDAAEAEAAMRHILTDVREGLHSVAEDDSPPSVDTARGDPSAT